MTHLFAPNNTNGHQANDLNELKKLQKPSDIIKLIFDCVGLLKMEKVQPVQVDEITIGIGKEKQTLPFLKVTGIGHFQCLTSCLIFAIFFCFLLDECCHWLAYAGQVSIRSEKQPRARIEELAIASTAMALFSGT